MSACALLTTDATGWAVWRGASFGVGGESAGDEEGGSRYLVVHKSLTFYGAQDACRRYGAHLVHVNSLREQAFLEEFVQQELTAEGTQW